MYFLTLSATMIAWAGELCRRERRTRPQKMPPYDIEGVLEEAYHDINRTTLPYWTFPVTELELVDLQRAVRDAMTDMPGEKTKLLAALLPEAGDPVQLAGTGWEPGAN